MTDKQEAKGFDAMGISVSGERIVQDNKAKLQALTFPPGSPNGPFCQQNAEPGLVPPRSYIGPKADAYCTRFGGPHDCQLPGGFAAVSSFFFSWP
jgi:hypothetical protein